MTMIILTTNLFTRQMIDLTTVKLYYTPGELVQTIGQQNSQLSMFSTNCRRINANWDSLNELIFNMSSERFHFDCICLTEVYKLHDNVNYSIADIMK